MRDLKVGHESKLKTWQTEMKKVAGGKAWLKSTGSTSKLAEF